MAFDRLGFWKWKIRNNIHNPNCIGYGAITCIISSIFLRHTYPDISFLLLMCFFGLVALFFHVATDSDIKRWRGDVVKQPLNLKERKSGMRCVRFGYYICIASFILFMIKIISPVFMFIGIAMIIVGSFMDIWERNKRFAEIIGKGSD